MARCAVIQFPGSNCEYETARSLRFANFDVEIIRWNCTEETFHSFDAFVLPGGFSYQDRVRAGAISAKLPIIGFLKEAAKLKKPILGICNGCQILAEAGLIPDTDGQGAVDVLLGKNTRAGKPFGFVCDWVFVKPENPQKSLFTRHFSEDDVIPIPINHGEGRFEMSESTYAAVSEQSIFRYVDERGVVDSDKNPNGAQGNLAAVCNAEGTVMAIMPHPERATFLSQVPDWIPSSWSDKKRAHMSGESIDKGPWFPLFQSMEKSCQHA